MLDDPSMPTRASDPRAPPPATLTEHNVKSPLGMTAVRDDDVSTFHEFMKC
jgi:hypothetical protein